MAVLARRRAELLAEDLAEMCEAREAEIERHVADRTAELCGVGEQARALLEPAPLDVLAKRLASAREHEVQVAGRHAERGGNPRGRQIGLPEVILDVAHDAQPTALGDR